jgi:cell division protein FtsB
MANGQKEKQKKSPVLVIVSLAVGVSFALSFFVGQRGILKLRQLRNEYDRVLMENYQLAMENKRTTQEIKKLRHDPATVEKVAREELLFVSPHDIVLVVPEEGEQEPVPH